MPVFHKRADHQFTNSCRSSSDHQFQVPMNTSMVTYSNTNNQAINSTSISITIASLDAPTKEEILDFLHHPDDIDRRKADRAEREAVQLVATLLGPNISSLTANSQDFFASFVEPNRADCTDVEAKRKRRRERNTQSQQRSRQRKKEKEQERRLESENLVPPGFRLL